MFSLVAGLADLPVNFVFTFAMLYWYFGASFIVSLLPFFVALLVNKLMSKRRKELGKERLRREDIKQNILNETLTNAKMLKLYGW